VKNQLPSAKRPEEKEKTKASKLIKLEVKYIKEMYPEYKQVAGLSGMSEADQKIIRDMEKYMEKKGLSTKKIPNLSGLKEAKEIARKHNIDLDNINI
jgi:hypothetical protein